jgi:cystathionine beta-lyase/cystathionine gamma-synthase
MLSLRLEGGMPAVERLLSALRVPTVAPSLGGVETLVTLPARTSHAGMDPRERERLGLTDDLIRVSCGIESSADLISDFAHALDAVAVPTG